MSDVGIDSSLLPEAPQVPQQHEAKDLTPEQLRCLIGVAETVGVVKLDPRHADISHYVRLRELGLVDAWRVREDYAVVCGVPAGYALVQRHKSALLDQAKKDRALGAGIRRLIESRGAVQLVRARRAGDGDFFVWHVHCAAEDLDAQVAHDVELIAAAGERVL